MTIGEHIEEFEGRPIENWNPERGVQNPEAAIRLGLEYDTWEDGTKMPELLVQLCDDPLAPQIKALVIGPWTFESDDDAGEVYAKLCEPAVVEALSSLEALFVGDITYEESEISWITQADAGPVLRAYPKLKVLRLRGGNNLRLGAIDAPALEKLVIETGGLSRAVIEEVCNAKAPNLRHLELWLGSENYGADHSVDDLMPLLSGRLFPKLRYLGLRDCEYTDDVARAAAEAPVLSQLDVLDLSKGTFGDDGARALLASAQARKLPKLDVSHHYMSPEVARELALFGPVVVADEAQGPNAERYISVSE
jgi:hypothetical protein